MKLKKKIGVNILFLMVGIFLLTFISGEGLEVGGNLKEIEINEVSFEIPEPPITNLSFAWVNSSNFWDALDTPADILHSDLDNLEWSVAGHTIDVDVDMNSHALTNIFGITSGDGTSQPLRLYGTGGVIYMGDSDDSQGAVSHSWYFNSEVEVNKEMELEEGVGLWVKNNIVADGYFYGQPLDGAIGSGILNASSLKVHCGSVNVSDEGGLNVWYPDMKIKIWNYGQNIYCNIPADTVAVPDNAHTVYYVDSNCVVQNTDWATYFSKDLNPPNFVRIFDVYTNNGDIGFLKGGSVLGLKQLREDFSKINCQRSGHLSICDGLTITPSETFSEINMSS